MSKTQQVEGENFWTCTHKGRFLRGMREVSYGGAVPAAAYKVSRDDTGRNYIIAHNIVTDKLIRVPDSDTDKVLAAITDFYGREEKFRRYGLTFKRGILLDGPPGCGKTALCNLITDDFIQRGGVVLLGQSPGWNKIGIGLVRSIEPRRRILVILEDIEDVIDNGDEHDLLSLLDGQDQFDGVVFVATTNYLEKLPPRIKDRPSRFDEVIHVGMPSAEVRRQYLLGKVKHEDATRDQIEEWVAATDGLSIAHLKEFMISVLCLGRDPVETTERLIRMGEPTEEDEDDD